MSEETARETNREWWERGMRQSGPGQSQRSDEDSVVTMPGDATACGNYDAKIDSIGRGAVIGSAWRWAIFQPPSSRRHIVVARSENGLECSAPANFKPGQCSISWMYAKSSLAYSAIRSKC